jgi:hypothetical protein
MRRKKYSDSQQLLPVRLRNRDPKITFSKNGTILFNSPASKLLKLKKGTKISFALNDTVPHDWFVFIDQENGFELHVGSDKETIFFSHRRLIRAFLGCYTGLREKITYKFIIDEDPVTIVETKTKLWRILVEPKSADSS